MLKVSKASRLKGEIEVPGDKSISHRAVMLGSIGEGETLINNFLMGEDCKATIDCFQKLGISILVNGTQVKIQGKGLRGLSKSENMLDVGNSGTSIRLISGILAGQNFETIISGDESIQKRPMKRIVEPLCAMGASISGNELKKGEKMNIFPPLTICGGELRPIKYSLPISSAQVKSCLLLAGLYANGETTIIEPAESRDHTERMFGYFGIPLTKFNNEVMVGGIKSFEGREIDVPGDLSSAAFFLVAAALVPNPEIIIRNVGVNPTRTGILEVLHRMGVALEVKNERIISGEPRGEIVVSSKRKAESGLSGIEISGDLIPRLIDEIPIIAVLATQAQGKTIIKDAKELRVKESDRIKTVAAELNKMGAKIIETADGLIIEGPTKLTGTTVESHGDHRLAMSLAIAGLIAEGETIIENTECIETSFPGFESLLKSIT